MTQTTPEVLAFVSAGDSQSSLTWLSSKTELYDIAVVWYGSSQNKPTIDAKYFIEQKGFKVPNFIKLTETYPEVLNYKYYFFIDDDLIAEESLIEEWLRKIKKHNLDLSQPSLTAESAHSWPHLIQKKNKRLCMNEFIECQCFAISKRLFDISFPYFKFITSGFGLDLTLHKLCKMHKFRFAVIHELSFFHPKREEAMTVRGKIPNFYAETKKILTTLEEKLGAFNLSNMHKRSHLVKSTSPSSYFSYYFIKGFNFLKTFLKRLTNQEQR